MASVTAQGGMGGVGTAGAAGGAGSDITLVNAVSGSTSGALELTQTAAAGAGGGSANGLAGSGGGAVSRLVLNDTRANSIAVKVQAVGGWGGRSTGPRGTPGNGGAAEGVLDLKAAKAGGSATGNVLVQGGWTTGVPTLINHGGEAVARSTVQADRSASSVAQATAGTGDNYANAPYPRSANAEAHARALSNGSASAVASAYSDDASTKGVATAEAAGGNGPTLAEAHVQAGQAEVRAHSSALGAASNSARAGAFAKTGSVLANSVSLGAGGERVSTTARTSIGSDHADVATSANVGGALEVMQPMMFNNLSFATGAPDAATAAAAFSATPRVAGAFADSRVVGIGTMTGVGGNVLDYNVVTSANFQFDTTTKGYLQLGLLDAELYPSWAAEGTGRMTLTISDHGTEVFARSFANLDAAQAFFSDDVVTLGMLLAGNHDLLVTAGFTIDGSAGLNFTYALGVSAVPEPQAWLLLMLGGTLLMLRRRSRD